MNAIFLTNFKIVKAFCLKITIKLYIHYLWNKIYYTHWKFSNVVV